MRRSVLIASLLVSLTGVLDARQWPHWRGPSASGVSAEKGLPVKWSNTRRHRLEGNCARARHFIADRLRRFRVRHFAGRHAARRGRAPGSSRAPTLPPPVNARLGAVRAPATTTVTFLLSAFDRASGKRAWEHELPAEGDLYPVHEKHNLASPSPVTDGERVYAWFGTGPDCGRDDVGQARVDAAHRPRLRRVRDQLGSRELARRASRPGGPALLSRQGVLSARPRRQDRCDALEGGRRPPASRPTARRSWSRLETARKSSSTRASA